MSRIGNTPIAIPEKVKVEMNWPEVTVNGPQGTLKRTFSNWVKARIEDNVIYVEPKNKSKSAKEMWGLSRSLIANMVKGVSDGFQKKLLINGVGYKASCDGVYLTVSLGYSHDIKFTVPQGIKITCPKPTEILIEGSDNQLVGEMAAVIRNERKPEPYKGKGVKEENEYIVRKEGKKK